MRRKKERIVFKISEGKAHFHVREVKNMIKPKPGEVLTEREVKELIANPHIEVVIR